MTGRALIVQGDALHLPLPDESVDLIVTSPPFYQLRQYDAAGIGLEATPQDYLDALLAATREMVRVLKPTGSLFIELGDKYQSTAPNTTNAPHRKYGQASGQAAQFRPDMGVPAKSLYGLPWRYALRCVDTASPYHRAKFYEQLAGDLMDSEVTPDRGRQLAAEFEASPKSKGLGLILRAPIVWHHVNGLPESVRDRVRMDHSTVFHLVKSPRYYAALDTLREPHADHSIRYAQPARGPGQGTYSSGSGRYDGTNGDDGTRMLNPLGKLPGSVWAIASDPLRLPPWLGVDHYAAWPPELPRRLILGWSPPGVCVECGQGRRPVVDRGEPKVVGGAYKAASITAGYDNGQRHGQGASTLGYERQATILGWACSCTPFTDHPGTGESSGPFGVPGHRGNPNGRSYPNTEMGLGHDGLGGRPRVGPGREYHLDQWQPPPTRPAVVLDPFGGTGTTAMVARALGRIGISVDLSHAYGRAARWRCFEGGEWQQVIERTTGRKARPLPKHDPAQPRLL